MGLIGRKLASVDPRHERIAKNETHDRFVVLPGHSTPEIETVVEKRNGYLVVDKFGEAEEIAEDESG